MRKNLIAIDMDGTLLNEQQQISAENVQAIKRRAEQDVIYICSGRDHFDISKTLAENGLELPIASLNGSLILSGETKIFANPFKRSEMQALFHQVEELPYLLFTNEGTYGAPEFLTRMKDCFAAHGEPQNQAQEQEVLAYMAAYVEKNKLLAMPADLLADPELEVYKIAVYLPDGAFSRAFHDTVEEKFSLSLTSSGLNDFELLPPGVDKGQTFALLSEFYQLDAVRTVAIGDSPNDLPMMKKAELSFAVENASDTVKKICDHVVPANDADGVAYALNQLDTF